MTASELLRTAELACLEAGKAILAGVGPQMPVEVKRNRHDLVTECDIAAEQLIVELVQDRYPGSCVVGEEGTCGDAGDGALRWFVDPIDGTGNFVHELPMFCISIGVELDGRLVAGCIHDPVRAETFSACDGLLRLNGETLPEPSRRGPADILLTDFPHDGGLHGPEELECFAGLVSAHGLRRIGSSALALAYVAAGRADLACNLGVAAWDVAAGACLVEAAGGMFTGLDWTGRPGNGAAWEQPIFVACRNGGENAEASLRETFASYLRRSRNRRGRAAGGGPGATARSESVEV